MKLTIIANAIVAVLSSAVINVDATSRTLQDICVCSPRAFSFTLLLAQDCSINTLESNSGISDTDCQIVNVTQSSTVTNLAEDEAPAILNDVDVSVEEIVACIPWLDNKNCELGEDIIEVEDDPGRNRLFHNEVIGKRRYLQTGSPIPDRITTIQFIELDSAGTVIQIDDSQNNIEAVSGDTFSFASVSSLLDPAQDISSQLDRVPKTAVLFMVGFNENGDEIRGRFVWEYTNGCADELPIIGNEDFAWVSFDQVDRAGGEFCPATSQPETPPTPAPLIIDRFPTVGPMILTPLPTNDPTLPPVMTPGPTFIFSTPEPTPSPVIPTLPPTVTPTPAPSIINSPFPTSSPVVPTPPPVQETTNPTSSPSELTFPTFSPTYTPTKDDVPMPTAQRPTPSPTENLVPTDEPTYFETGDPTFVKSRVPTTQFPTTLYGYGETNPSYGNGKDHSTLEYAGSSTESSKGDKSAGSPSGKSGKAYVAKSSKGASIGGKSGKGGKNAGKRSKTSNVIGKSGKSHVVESKHGTGDDSGHEKGGTWSGVESGPERKRMLREQS